MKKLSFILLCIYFIACSKPNDLTPVPPPPTGQPPTGGQPPSVVNDSVFLLTTINGNFSSGESFNFEYDNNNNLIKISRPYSWALSAPCYVMYKNGKVSNVISECNDYIYNTKASMVFSYGNNGKCSKVYYKYPSTAKFSNDNTYFSDVSDGNFNTYDSLVYSPTNQLMQIFRQQIINANSETIQLIKFTYGNTSDTTLNKLEEYHFSNGNPILYDQLLIIPNTINNPINKLLWYFPFVYTISYLSGGGGNVMWLPILYDDPSTSLEIYTPLISKTIKNYKVYNTYGSYNYTTTFFNYAYSTDSLLFQSIDQANPSLYVNYKFKKVKR